MKKFALWIGMISLFIVAIVIQPEKRSARLDQDVGITISNDLNATQEVFISPFTQAPEVVYTGYVYSNSAKVSAVKNYSTADRLDLSYMNNQILCLYPEDVRHLPRSIIISQIQNEGRFRLDIGENLALKI